MRAARLQPFNGEHAEEVAGWPSSRDEAQAWGGRSTSWPAAASDLRAWHEDPDVRPWVLTDDGDPVAYGEIWVDAEEREVELGRIVVKPELRGRGLGRLLVTLLLEQATQTGLPAAFVRVAPGNAAALACYRGAGFAPVTSEERRRFNADQPLEYEWLRRDLTRTGARWSARRTPPGRPGRCPRARRPRPRRRWRVRRPSTRRPA